MKKIILMSLLAISSAGLYADYYYGNPNQGNWGQPQRQGYQQMQRNFGQLQKPGCPNQRQGGPSYYSQGRNSMPYTTIVNEEAQGEQPRQQYYYFGSDRNRADENNDNNDDDDDEDDDDDNNNTYFNTNKENNGSSYNNNNGNGKNNNNRGMLQGTYFNRNAQTDASSSDTFRSDSDRALGQRIRDAIKGGWFSKGYEQISLDVNNGVVTIKGFVATFEDKNNVENAVKNVTGVNSTRNQLNVKEGKDQNPSLMNRFNTSDNPNNPRPMNNMRSMDNQLSAADTRGMNAYQNGTTTNMDTYNTTTKPTANGNGHLQDRATTDTDKQLNKRIRDAISGGWFTKKYETIVLRTDKGVVTIEGFVESFDDQRKLNDEIRKIEGVRSVNNNAQVKNKSGS